MRDYGSRHLRVFIVDDHDIVRRGLRDLLTKRDITIVGDSGSAREAPGSILRLRPDVMVLDVRLPDGSGVQVCRDVRSVDPSIVGLLLTSAADEDALILSVLAGASGFVIKLARTNEILDAVRRIGVGKPVLDSALLRRVSDDIVVRANSLQPPLTARQADILALVLDGKTDQQVADALHDPVALVRDEVALLCGRLTTTPNLVDWRPPGKHRRSP